MQSPSGTATPLAVGYAQLAVVVAVNVTHPSVAVKSSKPRSVGLPPLCISSRPAAGVRCHGGVEAPAACRPHGRGPGGAIKRGAPGGVQGIENPPLPFDFLLHPNPSKAISLAVAESFSCALFFLPNGRSPLHGSSGKLQGAGDRWKLRQPRPGRQGRRRLPEVHAAEGPRHGRLCDYYCCAYCFHLLFVGDCSPSR